MIKKNSFFSWMYSWTLSDWYLRIFLGKWRFYHSWLLKNLKVLHSIPLAHLHAILTCLTAIFPTIHTISRTFKVTRKHQKVTFMQENLFSKQSVPNINICFLQVLCVLQMSFDNLWNSVALPIVLLHVCENTSIDGWIILLSENINFKVKGSFLRVRK